MGTHVDPKKKSGIPGSLIAECFCWRNKLSIFCVQSGIQRKSPIKGYQNTKRFNKGEWLGEATLVTDEKTKQNKESLHSFKLQVGNSQKEEQVRFVHVCC